MALGELALKGITTILYAIAFCCAIIDLGIYGYFLAVLDRDNLHIDGWIRATTGLAGAASVYLLLAVLLTCCLGGVAFLSWIGVLLDLVFFGVFIAIAVLTRDGAHSCKGIVKTPLGTGDSQADAPGVSDYGYACTLNKVAFAVSLIGAGVLLFFAIPFQIWTRKYAKRSKRRSAPAGRSWNPMSSKKTAPPATTGYDPVTVENGPGGYHTPVGTGKDF